jgi:hypothetical protein
MSVLFVVIKTCCCVASFPFHLGCSEQKFVRYNSLHLCQRLSAMSLSGRSSMRRKVGALVFEVVEEY